MIPRGYVDKAPVEIPLLGIFGHLFFRWSLCFFPLLFGSRDLSLSHSPLPRFLYISPLMYLGKKKKVTSFALILPQGIVPPRVFISQTSSYVIYDSRLIDLRLSTHRSTSYDSSTSSRHRSFIDLSSFFTIVECPYHISDDCSLWDALRLSHTHIGVWGLVVDIIDLSLIRPTLPISFGTHAETKEVKPSPVQSSRDVHCLRLPTTHRAAPTIQYRAQFIIIRWRLPLSHLVSRSTGPARHFRVRSINRRAVESRHHLLRRFRGLSSLFHRRHRVSQVYG